MVESQKQTIYKKLKTTDKVAVSLCLRAYEHPKHREASLDPVIYGGEDWYYQQFVAREECDYKTKYREIELFTKNENIEVWLVESKEQLWLAIKTPIGKFNREMLEGLNGNDRVL